MPKRTNRLGPIEHERRQIEALKRLEPIETGVKYMPLSDALIDLCLAALDEVAALERREAPDVERLRQIVDRSAALLQQLPE